MRQRSIIDYLFFIEAWVLLHFSKILILIIPFRKIASFIGTFNVETEKDRTENIVVQHIERSIHRASRFCTYNTKCYDQALAGKMMLKRRKLPSTIYFGLCKKETEILHAHAWLRVGDRIITGKAGIEAYTVVASYGDQFTFSNDRRDKNKLEG